MRVVLLVGSIAAAWVGYYFYDQIARAADWEQCAALTPASEADAIILGGAVRVACMGGKGHRYDENNEACDRLSVSAECFDPPANIILLRF